MSFELLGWALTKFLLSIVGLFVSIKFGIGMITRIVRDA